MPLLMATRLLASSPDVPMSAREALDMIERNLRIEARFIDDLLDFTRACCGKMQAPHKTVDIHDVISHALEVTRANVSSKNQQITVELQANCHKVSGDATRLQQVIWNLLKSEKWRRPFAQSAPTMKRAVG